MINWLFTCIYSLLLFWKQFPNTAIHRSFYVLALEHEDFYNQCDSYADVKKHYTSGNDRVVLDKGFNYFVPYDSSYCQKGMKPLNKEVLLGTRDLEVLDQS